ncbi:MAG: SurA N-terminal domain-containing protein [Pelagibacteraceae bacterium]
MLTSIKKATSSFFTKVLIGLIILPFVFWGMGDVFRTGNQNVLVNIDAEKIGVQNFVNYLSQLNLTDEQRKNLSKTDLLDRILSDYIGKKIIAMEIETGGVKLSNNSLKEIITSDETFKKDNQFSRTEYEKFLLENRMSPTMFEQNISEQEKKRQLLTYLSEGINLPNFLINKEFQNENQNKTIQYLELDDLYKNKKFTDEEIKKIYDENKQFLVREFKKINFVELLPSNLTGQPEYNEAYFKRIDEIENGILDGKKVNDFAQEFNLSLKTINETDRNKKNKLGQDIIKLEDGLFERIFNVEANKASLINLNNKYFLSEVESINQITRDLEDKEIRDAITSQLKIKYIAESNIKIVKQLSEGKFKKEQFDNFSKENNIPIKNTTLKNLEDETIFNKDIIREIFKVKDNELQLITDSTLTKNYIIYSVKTEFPPFDKNNKKFTEYETKAKLGFSNQIYGTFDAAVNERYDVKINEKVLTRIKNTL